MKKPKVVLLALVTAILVGAALRIYVYSRNYSFFLDECALALNIESHDLSRFTRTLDYNQAAPLGFLLIESTIARLVGASELALRFIPFVISLLCLVSFWKLSGRVLTGWSVAAAVWLVSVNHGLIAYSAQAKQYSLEILSAILILDLCRPFFVTEPRSMALWRRTVCVGLLLWFSFSAVFVLAGVGVVMVVQSLISRGRDQIIRSAGIGAVWLGMLIPVFLFSIKPGLQNSALKEVWTAGYVPWSAPGMIPAWVAARVEEVCRLILNKRLWPLAGGGLVAGACVAVRRKEWHVLAAGAGLLMCGAAAGLQLYPFDGRLLLFLVPGLVIILVGGTEWVIEIARPHWRVALQVVAVVAVLWCIQSAARASLLQRGYIDEPREALRFLHHNWQQGDHIVATRLATPCLLYYTDSLSLDRSSAVVNVIARDELTVPPGLSARIPSGRTWLVEMRTPWEKRGESVPVQEFFELRGRKVTQFDAEWTSIILFDVP